MIQNVSNSTSQLLNTVPSTLQNKVIDSFSETENGVNSIEKTADNKEPVMHNGVDISKFKPEDVERWDQMVKNCDPVWITFSILATESNDNSGIPGVQSMHFYDFCSTIESGQVISEQNVADGKVVYANRKDNLEYVIMNSLDQYGKVNKNQNNQILNIIKKCYDLGMMTKEHGLLLPSEFDALKQKQKYNEQPVFQTRQSINNLEEKQNALQKLYKTQVIQNSYQNSIKKLNRSKNSFYLFNYGFKLFY